MADNGRSATDIITYIGVPLAVLGVLPIMYNTVLTLLNASRIKSMLRHSRLTALTRSDVVNRIIEIELPRYAVTPWDRFQNRLEYWTLSRNPSSIPGGSWTTFNWRTNAIGFKTQRVEYADQLRQPQVDVAFDELVAYMLDLGAVPDAHGWRLLRSSGLWTPVGCSLMKSPDGQHSALMLAPLDDADGNLSLSVTWEPEWTSRSFSDLPPYWVSMPAPPPEYKEVEKTAEPSTPTTQQQEEPATATPSLSRPATAGTKDAGHVTDGLVATAEPGASIRKSSFDSVAHQCAVNAQMPITCQISVDGIVAALTEEKRRVGQAGGGGIGRNNTAGSGNFPLSSSVSLDSLYIEHIRVRTGSGQTDGVWFASAATAYGTTSQTILWNYRIPEDILTFARRETVPCGVLVLLGAADESETPEWATHHAHDHQQTMELHMQRLNEQRAAEQAEMRLTPQDREAAVRARMQREGMQRISDMRARLRQDQDRREKREMEALHSPRWDTLRVAEHSLRWLHKNKPQLLGGSGGAATGTRSGGLSTATTSVAVKDVVGFVLHRMVRDGQFAGQLCRMLDRWKTWADLGGMRKTDLQALQVDMELFAYATLLMALIKDTSTALEGTLSVDLQDCLRMWRKVRLG